jgi:hypothetical protein
MTYSALNIAPFHAAVQRSLRLTPKV